MYDYLIEALIELEDGEVPCQIGVTITDVVEGSLMRNDVSDMDYYGYVDYKYDVLDEDGNKMENVAMLKNPQFDRYVQSLINETIGDH